MRIIRPWDIQVNLVDHVGHNVGVSRSKKGDIVMFCADCRLAMARQQPMQGDAIYEAMRGKVEETRRLVQQVDASAQRDARVKAGARNAMMGRASSGSGQWKDVKSGRGGHVRVNLGCHFDLTAYPGRAQTKILCQVLDRFDPTAKGWHMFDGTWMTVGRPVTIPARALVLVEMRHGATETEMRSYTNRSWVLYTARTTGVGALKTKMQYVPHEYSASNLKVVTTSEEYADPGYVKRYPQAKLGHKVDDLYYNALCRLWSAHVGDPV